MNEFASELSAVEAATENASASMAAVQSSVDGFVSDISKQGQNSAETNIQRMGEAFSAFSNNSFIETHADIRVDDGHTHAGKSAVTKVNSGLPVRPRLRSLLAQHDHLAKLHQGLSVRNDQLGKEVSEVAEIGRKFNEVSE